MRVSMENQALPHDTDPPREAASAVPTRDPSSRASSPMPKLGSALQQAEPPGDPTTQRPGSGRVLELKVGGHLMTLEAGLFCVFHAPGSSVAEASSGLPGVRISRPPGRAGRPDDVLISTFREDGWLSGDHDAALIRVAEGPAQILVTVYQSPQAADAAPRLQVLQLSAAPTAAPVRA